MSRLPWWAHLAHFGSSTAVGFMAAGQLMQLVPGPVAIIGGLVSGGATLVAHYAGNGLKSIGQ